MPRVPTPVIVGFGRGLVRSGAIRPTIISAGVIGTALAIPPIFDARGRQQNPPFQEFSVPKDGQVAVGDPRTGSITVLADGQAPQQAVGPERSNERETKTLYLVLGAVGVAVALAVAMRGG